MAALPPGLEHFQTGGWVAEDARNTELGVCSCAKGIGLPSSDLKERKPGFHVGVLMIFLLLK